MQTNRTDKRRVKKVSHLKSPDINGLTVILSIHCSNHCNNNVILNFDCTGTR